MPIPATNQRAAANRRLLRDDVYERLLAAIVDTTLEPGERLRDEELASWLGVSRTPIREAISRLVDIGLIEMEPNRFTRVAPLDRKRFCDTQKVIGTLSRLAAKLAVPKMTKPLQQRIVDLLHHAREIDRFERRGLILDSTVKAFLLIVEAAENMPLLRSVKDSLPDLHRVLLLASPYVDTNRVNTFLNEFADAVSEGDGTALGNVLEQQCEDFAEELWDATTLWSRAATTVWTGSAWQPKQPQ